VPTAGLGKRLGPGTNKPFTLVLNRPLIVWTLEALHRVEEITEIIPVIKESDIAAGADIVEGYHFSKIRRIAPGGRERQDSVYNGLKLVNGEADIVIVHDGVRPFIDAESIRCALSAMRGVDGVVTAVPVKDTIKEVEPVDGESAGQGAGCVVRKTLNRDTLWAAQTPQVFLLRSLMGAYEKATAERFYGTDDSVLVERNGGKVKVIMGSYENIKITTSEDISVAEMLLKKRLGI
jgi:2-C-methyl-D-erythritol 4-phosphate cytidylyltransferase